ncbi:hypothetical protein OS493_005445 [Desmophyllum pertusum]|uniref:Uncharacterized protein n=1 Tax=Desmophyllum pertusum TaxID=174260 RepID=A0A9X0CM89_9CNID|nr:hypothetical protein OS493_005445 [Desmophyllum pertusum]
MMRLFSQKTRETFGNEVAVAYWSFDNHVSRRTSSALRSEADSSKSRLSTMHRSTFAQLFCLIWPVLAAGLVYECNFDGTKLKEGTQQNFSSSSVPMAFIKQLPPLRTQSHSCIVTTNGKDSFLQVKAKTYGKINDAVHVSVYGADETSLGHLDSSGSGSWSTLTACPQKSSQRYFVLFTGTPNVSYAAEITDNVPNVTLGQRKSFQVTHTTPAVFQFTPFKGISKKQLDITVESNSPSSAYLKVSHTCEEVVGNDIKYLNYKGESLRLSFAEKGRITLSKASLPPLEDADTTWFIGIALIKDKTASNVTKNVTLTLKSSFDYDYSTPFYFLIGLSFFGGILVALWALFCFREPYILVHENNHFEDSVSFSASSNAASTGIKDNLKSLFSSCWGGRKEDAQTDELRPLLGRPRDKTPLTWKELALAMKSVLFNYWFAQGPKTFSYTTCIVGFVLLVGLSSLSSKIGI